MLFAFSFSVCASSRLFRPFSNRPLKLGTSGGFDEWGFSGPDTLALVCFSFPVCGDSTDEIAKGGVGFLFNLSAGLPLFWPRAARDPTQPQPNAILRAPVAPKVLAYPWQARFVFLRHLANTGPWFHIYDCNVV
jgi:hypothetical protein